MKTYILPILAASTISANAAIVAIGSVSPDSTFNGGVNATNTINGTGLSGAITQDSELLSVTHNETGNAGGQWHTAVGVTGSTTITYNLSSASDLGSIWLWQANQTSELNRGVNQFDILISTDNGVNFTEVSTDLILAQSAGGNINAQGFDLSGTSVTNVRLQIDTNHGGNVVGLSEVRFSSNSVAAVNTTAVPEPSASALLGLGGLALILRRRK